MYDWHKIDDFKASDLPADTLREVSVGERRAGLLKRENTIYAFAATCPHTGAPLCEGWLDARGHIVCPLHKYHFNPANGYNSSGEGYKLRTYHVEIRNDEIFIGIIPSSL